MSEIIDAIIKTRELSVKIASESLREFNNISEVELHNLIADDMSEQSLIFPEGYYNPPPKGVSVLFDTAPFERLLYGSLRDPIYWPNKNNKFTKESVGNIYFSPVNKTSKTLGDIGFTVYRGDNQEIKNHLKKSHDAILEIAKRAEIGMKFSELCVFASDLFKKNNLKPSKRILMSSDQNQNQYLNLGHTVPGSLKNDKKLEGSFEEIKENIRAGRIHFTDLESFEIPETCAFTVECRLEDSEDLSMPSASWHFMVCFDEGKKTILSDYDAVFKAAGMDYMNLRHGVDVN